ncbi:type II toxin-antitoxin system RelE/ParE family toxin [Amaricoccus sp.]|uniref:type II toxin-antitoxin system RelE/ParE family toxin n=1 Tax=Amaricoccus sp. TaxID=1872485 RepID=UPI00262D19F8|nr:type II toxin-antitoxin system RelE/ParE family toxin [Amaricoccus sp.]HRO12960.1 type II toxin-antitoxin system RelE/ParE family toxin [Amaricoccus sp.]
MKVALKPRARADLLAIRAWGEDHWGIERTRDFLEGLVEAIERLAEFPLMGRGRSAFLAGLRSLRHRGYLIFYVIEADRPVVIAVIHERRNLAALDFADRIEGE